MCKKEGGQKSVDEDLCFFSFGPSIGARLDGLLGQQNERQTNKQTFKQNTKSSIGEQTSFFNYSYLMAVVVPKSILCQAHMDKIDLIFKKDLLRYNSY